MLTELHYSSKWRQLLIIYMQALLWGLQAPGLGPESTMSWFCHQVPLPTFRAVSKISTQGSNANSKNNTTAISSRLVSICFAFSRNSRSTRTIAMLKNCQFKYGTSIMQKCRNFEDLGEGCCGKTSPPPQLTSTIFWFSWLILYAGSFPSPSIVDDKFQLILVP